jgi:hypothetical protein
MSGHKTLGDRWTPARRAARAARRLRRLDTNPAAAAGADAQAQHGELVISRQDVRQAQRRELREKFGNLSADQRRELLTAIRHKRRTSRWNPGGLLERAAAFAGIRIRRRSPR